jgi:biotin synthase
MENKLNLLIDKLALTHSLTLSEYEYLIENRTQESADRLRELAVRVRREHYGNAVYIRGLIEISNICKNDCIYCGIR